MAKTKEELNQLKQEYDSLTNKLKELSEDELKEVIGGADFNSNFSPVINISQGRKEKLTLYDEYDRH